MHKSKLHCNTLILLFVLLFFCFTGCTVDPVETDLLLPVEFSNVPENMVLTNFHSDKIEIRIKADPRLMERINKKDIRYSVDLYTDLEFDPAGDSDSIEPGSYFIPVEGKRISINRGIKILSINPSYLSVHLEKKVKKTFKITVPYIGTPAKGHIALDAAAEPASVELIGAASLIQSIKELKTKPVDITNVSESFKKKIPLDLENRSIITSSDPIITISVHIQQQRISKIIENIPVQVWNSTSKINIEPSKISIKIKGPFETLNNKEITDQIYAFIDLKGLEKGVYARHAYINIPWDLMMTDAVPKVFTIKIE